MSDAIPEFNKSKSGDGKDVSLTNLSAFASGPGIKSGKEVAAIIAVAVIIIGGIELALRLFHVPLYIMPPPSSIAYALFDEFPLIAPHLGYTLVELVSGFAIGAVVGLVLAAVITQFPFAEKIVAPCCPAWPHARRCWRWWRRGPRVTKATPRSPGHRAGCRGHGVGGGISNFVLSAKIALARRPVAHHLRSSGRSARRWRCR